MKLAAERGENHGLSYATQKRLLRVRKALSSFWCKPWTEFTTRVAGRVRFLKPRGRCGTTEGHWSKSRPRKQIIFPFSDSRYPCKGPYQAELTQTLQ